MISAARRAKMPVTGALIQRAALRAKDDILKQGDLQPKVHQAVSIFQASNKWLFAFLHRNGIKCKSLHGEAGSVDHDKIRKDIDSLRKNLSEFDEDCIFNVDETGLFFRLLPKKTYLCPTENRREARGTKALKAKDRLTLLLCTNATGSVRMPTAMIGTAKNPRYFRFKACPLPYLSQTNA